jgi:GTP-binding protein
MKNQFIDRVSIRIKAGDGGNGITSFIHYKGVVNGGPDGGDGGKGGDIIFRADRHVCTLAEYYYKNIYVAENGSNGEPKNCFGKAGKDLILNVPCGTIIRDLETNEIIADLFYDGDQVTVLKGGQGGKGEAHQPRHHSR